MHARHDPARTEPDRAAAEAQPGSRTSETREALPRKEHVVARLLIPLAIAIVCLTAWSVISTYRMKKHNLRLAVSHEVQEAGKQMERLFREDTIRLRAVLDTFVQDDEFKQLFRAGDREALFEYGQPLFQRLKKDYRITHFLFIRRDGTCFTRLHNPDKYDDKITRFALEEAMRTGKVASGIELGKTAFALRVVWPYYDGDELIGYVELGEQVDRILPIIAQGGVKEIAVFVDKKYLDRAKWASVAELHGRSGSWDEFEEVVLIDSTLRPLPAELRRYVSRQRSKRCEGHGYTGKHVRTGENTYALGYLPLRNASRREIGDILVLYDVTDVLATYRRTMRSQILAGLVIAAGLIALFFVALRWTLRNLTASRLAIQRHSARLGNALDQLRSFMATIAERQSFDVRFDNPNIPNCWEVAQCGKTDCPFYGLPGVRCWQICGTLTGGSRSCSLAEKLAGCENCDVFRRATTDPLHEIGEHFNNMMNMLQLKHDALFEAAAREKQVRDTLTTVLCEPDLDKVLQVLADSARELTGAEIGAIVLFDRKTGTIGNITPTNYPLDAIPPDVVVKGRGALAALAKADGVIRLDDVMAHPAFVGYPEWHPKVRALLGAPLKDDKGVFGLFALGHTDPARRFTEEHENIFTTLAGLATVAIRRAATLDDLQEAIREAEEASDEARFAREAAEQQVAETSAAYDELLALKQKLAAHGAILEAAGRTVNLDETLHSILGSCIEQLDFDGGGIYLIDPLSGDLVLRHAQGLSASFVEHVSRVPADQLDPAGAPNRDALFLENYDTDGPVGSDAVRAAEGLKSVASVPLFAGDTLVGRLNLGSHTRPTVGPEMREMLLEVGHLVSPALANALQAEDLERFNRAAAGREDRVIEMKREVNELLIELGREPKYRVTHEQIAATQE